MSKTQEQRAVLGVDTHAHIFTQQLTFVRAGEGYIPDYDATLASFLHKLDQHGLSHAVLIQPSFLGEDNSHLMTAVRSEPERLRAMVIAGPDTSQEQLEAMKAQGAVGTRLILYGTAPADYTEKRWKEFIQRVAALDWVVEIYAEAERLKSVCEPLLEANCRVLIDHYGRPDSAQTTGDPGFQYLLSLASTSRVWVDISGPYRSAPGPEGYKLSAEYFGVLREHFGLGRLLWGSDWPCVQFEPVASYSHSVDFLHQLLPQEADRLVILRDTPCELFGVTRS